MSQGSKVLTVFISVLVGRLRQSNSDLQTVARPRTMSNLVFKLDGEGKVHGHLAPGYRLTCVDLRVDCASEDRLIESKIMAAV